LQRGGRRLLRGRRVVAQRLQLTLRGLQALAGRRQLALELRARGSRLGAQRAQLLLQLRALLPHARSSSASWPRPASACSARRVS
jgi:hypothetical protein